MALTGNSHIRSREHSYRGRGSRSNVLFWGKPGFRRPSERLLAAPCTFRVGGQRICRNLRGSESLSCRGRGAFPRKGRLLCPREGTMVEKRSQFSLLGARVRCWAVRILEERSPGPSGAGGERGGTCGNRARQSRAACARQREDHFGANRRCSPAAWL